MKKLFYLLILSSLVSFVACGGKSDLPLEPTLEERLLANLSNVPMGAGPSFAEEKATVVEIEEYVLFVAQASFEGNQGLVEQVITQLGENTSTDFNFSNLSMSGPLGGTVSGSAQGKDKVLHLDATYSDFAYAEIQQDTCQL